MPTRSDNTTTLYQNLYIHVPFCVRKCAYCAFYSIPNPTPSNVDVYLQSLKKEFDTYTTNCVIPLKTVYIGGGTPTSLKSDKLAEFLRSIHCYFSISEDTEFTVECNPDTLTEEKIEILAKNNVNRISLGIQSFSSSLVAKIGRHRETTYFSHLVSKLQSYGLKNINIDLIYGIPEQDVDDWKTNLHQAFSLDNTHLSAYALSIDEKARLHKQCDSTSLPDDDLTVSMWQTTREIAKQYGFKLYEVSNLALPGYKCCHNNRIWHGDTYLGCGPSAASYDGTCRRKNPSHLEQYLRRENIEFDRLPDADRGAEIFGLGLRTAEGWHTKLFAGRTGYNLLEFRRREIDKLVDQNLLIRTNEEIRPTNKGLLFADMILETLL